MVVMVNHITNVQISRHDAVLQDRAIGRSRIALGHRGKVPAPQCNGMHAALANNPYCLKRTHQDSNPGFRLRRPE